MVNHRQVSESGDSVSHSPLVCSFPEPLHTRFPFNRQVLSFAAAYLHCAYTSTLYCLLLIARIVHGESLDYDASRCKHLACLPTQNRKCLPPSVFPFPRDYCSTFLALFCHLR